jgi:hypothetical protein
MVAANSEMTKAQRCVQVPRLHVALQRQIVEQLPSGSLLLPRAEALLIELERALALFEHHRTRTERF